MRGTLRNQPSPTLSVWGTAGDFYLERTSSHEGARKREGEEGGPKALGEVGEACPLEGAGAGRYPSEGEEAEAGVLLVGADGLQGGEDRLVAVGGPSESMPWRPWDPGTTTHPHQLGFSVLRRFCRRKKNHH